MRAALCTLASAVVLSVDAMAMAPVTEPMPDRAVNDRPISSPYNEQARVQERTSPQQSGYNYFNYFYAPGSGQACEFATRRIQGRLTRVCE